MEEAAFAVSESVSKEIKSPTRTQLAVVLAKEGEGTAGSFGKSRRDPRVGRTSKLQRAKEIQHILHLRPVKRVKSADYIVGFRPAALAG